MERNSQETECAVCQNNFVLPKILPCGHIFCRGCLIRLIDQAAQLHCPLCRKTIVSPTQRAARSSTSIVDDLPTDFVMDAVAASAEVLSQESQCCVCDDKRAESICIQCLDVMCSACSTIHTKFSATRDHTVESLSTVSCERLAASRPAQCAVHKDKHADLFCPSHNEAVCATCAFVKHKKCLKITDLDSEMKSAEKGIKCLNDSLTDAERKIEQTIGEMETNLEESARFQTLMETACANLVKICKKQKKESHRNNTIMVAVENTKVKIRDKLSTLKSHKRILERASKTSTRPGLIHLKRALQKRVSTLDLSTSFPDQISLASLPRMTDYEEFVCQINKELRQREQQNENPRAIQFSFHRNRGDKVILTNNRQVAKCKGFFGGTVVSCAALQTNFLYEIEVLETDGNWKPNVPFCGVTVTQPDDLNIKDYWWEMKEVFNIYTDFTLINHNSRIGFMVDSQKRLQLYFDGLYKGVALASAPTPCHVVFDLSNTVKKIRACSAEHFEEGICPVPEC